MQHQFQVASEQALLRQHAYPYCADDGRPYYELCWMGIHNTGGLIVFAILCGFFLWRLCGLGVRSFDEIDA